jgi:hypothetical protein
MSGFFHKRIARTFFVATLFFVILFSMQNVLASISIDNITVTAQDAQRFNQSHTINSNSTGLLVVEVSFRNYQSASNITSMNYSGTAMTFLGKSIHSI